MSDFNEKLSNFKNAIMRLQEAAELFKASNAGDVIRDGMIQRFEFTYELAWKSMRGHLESVGIVDVNSPRAVIKESYAQKLIINEQNWLIMLNDRNLTTHIYKEKVAIEIAERIVNIYIDEFDELLYKLQQSR